MEIKLATTTDEQIAKLKERGMIIANEQLAKDILLDIGYYRLGFFWFPLECRYPNKDNRDHRFKNDANFETSVRLYHFDKKLRNILSEYLQDIEVNVRTKVIYHISNHYKQNPTWFADNRIVMSQFISEFDQKYSREVANNEVIMRHHKKHINDKYAPAWKTLEYLSFGDLVRLIRNLKSEEDKKIIYNCYGLNDDKIFSNHIDVIRQLRNICAHGHPLFDMKLCKSIRAGKFRNHLKGKDVYSNIQGVFLVMQYFLYYLSEKRGNEFRDSLIGFFNSSITDDIRPMVGYMSGTPWLMKKI